MLRKHHGLGELEFDVLKTVWDRPDSTVQELADHLAGRRPCARTTILTVMQRLHAKGFLEREKRDGVFRYRASEPEKTVVSGLIGQFVDKVLDGSPMPFLTFLAEAKELSPEQVGRLREIVEELERNEQAQ